MKTGSSKLSCKKDEAIAALLSQRSTEEAARVANVPVKTLFRWMKEPEFDKAYREAKQASFRQSMARLQHMAAAAISTLGKIMIDPNAPAASRVRACHCILERAAQAIEIEEMQARLDELEVAAESSRQSHTK